MGLLISRLRSWAEKWSNNRLWALRLCGFLITASLVLVSGLSGWIIERLAMPNSLIPQELGIAILLIALASGLAARSLQEGVQAVLNEIPLNSKNPSLFSAREKLSLIVGRDVHNLDKHEILRAAAETTSENSVDGIFAPLFWMLIGATLWEILPQAPGPLALVWIFKASSTLDSMIGYRNGSLRWLGTAGARLDDMLTWIPCRIVVITLPLLTQPWKLIPQLLCKVWEEGSHDSSPNSGMSQAIFANCGKVQMGGINNYKGHSITKPILAAETPIASHRGVKRLLKMSLQLQIAWLTGSILMALAIETIKT